jgi:hypothetical protein
MNCFLIKIQTNTLNSHGKIQDVLGLKHGFEPIRTQIFPTLVIVTSREMTFLVISSRLTESNSVETALTSVQNGQIFQLSGIAGQYWQLLTVSSARSAAGAVDRLKPYLTDLEYRSRYRITAHKAFVRSRIEYGSIAYSAASKSHLEKFDKIQARFETEAVKLPTLESRRAATDIGLICKLLTSPRGPMIHIKPEFEEN